MVTNRQSSDVAKALGKVAYIEISKDKLDQMRRDHPEMDDSLVRLTAINIAKRVLRPLEWALLRGFPGWLVQKNTCSAPFCSRRIAALTPCLILCRVPDQEFITKSRSHEPSWFATNCYLSRAFRLRGDGLYYQTVIKCNNITLLPHYLTTYPSSRSVFT